MAVLMWLLVVLGRTYGWLWLFPGLMVRVVVAAGCKRIRNIPATAAT